jgi:hypothetical protein
VQPPSSKNAAIPEEAIQTTIFPWLHTFAVIILYKNALPTPARPLTKIVYPGRTGEWCCIHSVDRHRIWAHVLG